MKNIIIFLHTSNNENSDAKPWLQEFTKGLTQALEKFNIQVSAITNQKEAFLNSIGGIDTGCYLPVIDKVFLNSDDDMQNFRDVQNAISKRTGERAFTLSLIQEIVPLNYASFQPYYNFYNQGAFLEENKRGFNEAHLPGNNTAMTFHYHINNIAKEINYQIIKVASRKSSTKKVFISSTTSDLVEPVRSLYNYLLNNELEVSNPITSGNLSKEFLSRKINEQLENSWLAIHPLGSGSLNRNNFIGGNLTLCELENQLSTQHYTKSDNKSQRKDYFKRIIWIPKSTTLSTYEGRMIERIKSVANQNNNADILDCSMDEFKEIILSYYNDYKIALSQENELDESLNYFDPVDKVSDKNIELNSVLVILENKYIDSLKDLKKALKTKNYDLVTLKSIEGAPDYSDAKEKLLKSCNGVILMASSWNSLWFYSNINEVIKAKSIRENDFDFICVLSSEIDQLPLNISKNDVSLVRINSKINPLQLDSILNNKHRNF